MVRCDALNRYTGGVLIFVRNDIVYEQGLIYSEEGNFWCAFINIKINNSSWSIGCLYRSPSGSIASFLTKLEGILEENFTRNKKCLLLGDLNINYLNKEDFYCKKLISLLQSLGIEQVVGEATRCCKDSSSLIDYVLANNDKFVHKIFKTPKITDHFIIGVRLESNNNKVNTKKIVLTRCLSEQDYHQVNIDLLTCNWNYDSIDVNVIFNDLNEKCMTVINSKYPIREVRYRTDNVPWYDNEVREAALERDKAYKFFINYSNGSNSIGLWDDYKNKRNLVVNLLKQKKVAYYETKIDSNKNDSKEMWKCLKKLIKGKDQYTNYKNINFGTTESKVFVESESQAACKFNDYFTKSIEGISSGFDSCCHWSDSNLPVIESSIDEFQPVSIGELKQIIFSLKNCKNVNNVLNSQFLKKTFNTTGYAVLNLINSSLKSGSFPENLKTSTIIPVPKSQTKSEVSTYRPINTLPCIEKILEKAVYNQIVSYFNKNSLFLGNQSGFRKGHSCETAIQLTISKCKQSIDNNKYVIAVFLDLRRAFEIIDRDVLVKKLIYYGFKNGVIKWFKEYLTNRFQCVQVGNTRSTEKPNNYGVPQGSVLGALLFIIFMNDINHVEGLEFINLFADDTLIVCTGYDLIEVIARTQKLLKNTENFLNISKLKLNASKTKAMVISTAYKIKNLNITNLKLQIDNEDIEWVSQIKYLGFMLDNTLSLKAHFDYIHKKISKKLFFFNRISKHLSLFSRMTVFKSIIQPHFDYCSSVLYLSDAGLIQSLQVLFNKGMRTILRCNRYTPIELMQSTMGWFSVKDRLYYLTMVFIFKLKRGMLPAYFDEYIVLRGQIHSYGTRNINDFNIQKTNKHSTMISLFYKALSEFNHLPLIIKNAMSLLNFKKLIRCHVLEVD